MQRKEVGLTPAYGRDYKSKGEVREALFRGDDFTVTDIVSPWVGKPANIESLKNAGVVRVKVRYRKQRQVAIFNIQK